MGRHPINFQPAGVGFSRSGSLSGLAILLLYLLFPLIYYQHFAPPPFMASGFPAGVGIILMANNPEELPRPARHDRNPCPICQAAASFLDYASLPARQVPDCIFLLGLSFLGASPNGLANFPRLVADPRGPPLFSHSAAIF
jgi:hypothetical protein